MKKFRWITSLLCIVTIFGSLSGCSVLQVKMIEPLNSKKALSDQVIVETDKLDTTYINGMNEFAFELFSKQKSDENIFLSPYSITMALSMLYNGADTNTRAEIAKLLGYQLLPGYTKEYSKDSNEYMNANSKYLIEALRDADPKVVISTANSIWLSKDETFKDTIETALLAPVRNYYSGDIFQVDFMQDKTLKDVNDWVLDKTEGMIDPFLEQFSDPSALRLFLVNAIYFNGKWTIPFSPDDTSPQLFNGLNSSKTVDTMHINDESYRYYYDHGIKGIELPYGNESLVMDVLIPQDKENTTIGELYDQLTTDQVGKYLQQLDEANKVEVATLAFPKFKMEYGMVELNDTLQALGMKDAFNEEKADFNLINDNLFVSAVMHKAKIEVEEWGTKAAAATGLEMETTSVGVNDPLLFIVDVPFMYIIRDKQTNTILFMGQMNHME